MSDDSLAMERQDLKIEGDRNLYNYTFRDASGNVLQPEPALPHPAHSPGDREPDSKPSTGNLSSGKGENRKE